MMVSETNANESVAFGGGSYVNQSRVKTHSPGEGCDSRMNGLTSVDLPESHEGEVALSQSDCEVSRLTEEIFLCGPINQKKGFLWSLLRPGRLSKVTSCGLIM